MTEPSKPRGKMVKVECECCGLLFEARDADRKRGWAKFCGKACKAKAEAEAARAASPKPAAPKSKKAPVKPAPAATEAKPEVKPKAKMGAPAFKWTREIEDEILKRMAQGESLRSICNDEWLPSRITVRMRAVDDADFAARYARAREMQADEYFEEIREIADDSSEDFRIGPDGKELDKDHIQRAKLRVEARKWMAAKLRPKAYGDKIDVNHGGKLAVEQVKVSFEDAGEGSDE